MYLHFTTHYFEELINICHHHYHHFSQRMYNAGYGPPLNFLHYNCQYRTACTDSIQHLPATFNRLSDHLVGPYVAYFGMRSPLNNFIAPSAIVSALPLNFCNFPINTGELSLSADLFIPDSIV